MSLIKSRRPDSGKTAALLPAVFRVWLLSVLLFSCKTAIEHYTASIVPVDTIQLVLPGKAARDLQFGIKPVIRNDTLFLVTLDAAKKTMTFLNTYDQRKSFTIEAPVFSNKFTMNDFFTFSGNKLFYINISTGVLAEYRYDNLSMIYSGGINVCKSIPDTNIQLSYQQFPMEIDSPYAFLSIYSKEKSRKLFSYLDTFSTLQIKLPSARSQELSLKILPYPDVFFTGKIHDADTYCKKISDSEIVCAFRYNDSVYIYNTLSGHISARAQFSNNSHAFYFDKSQTGDLSYLRLYWETNESNVNMVTNKDQILIIRQMRRKELTDSLKYEYFLLGKKLNPLRHNIFRQNINPVRCYPFKKGFLIIDKILPKAYYYEML